jgi:hypothetical protein
MNKRTPADTVSSVMAQWGRLGGPARAKALSAKRRHEIAQKAARASAKVRSRKARARRQAAE